MKYKPFTQEQTEKFLKSDQRAKGIIDHEFDQDVIDRCEPKIQAMNQRIINGETTWEQEEAKLLAEWNKLHGK